MPENGHDLESPDVGMKEELAESMKICPFFQKPCLGAPCALWMSLTRTTRGPHGGFAKATLGMCSLPALCELISSRSPVQPMPARGLPANFSLPKHINLG